jgi:hypothetical protein
MGGGEVITPAKAPAPPGPVQAARQSVALNPVAVTYGAQIAVTLLAGFGLHLSRDQAGAVSTAITALAAIVTAVSVRPVVVPAVTGAAAAILTACAAFGLKLPPEQVSAAAGALGVILMLVTHAAVVPLAAARQGLTAHEILLAQTVRRTPQ